MLLRQLDRIDQYLELLDHDADEVSALFADLLIGVTNLFRDPEAFDALQATHLPTLLARRKEGDELRVWVPGCATGEEAYSIAIVCLEYLQSIDRRIGLEVFATDIDAEAIQTARRGVFPNSACAHVSPRRLSEFFDRDEASGTYQAKKRVRDAIVFCKHDLVRDPPFSRLDLISCRNLLIYLGTELQRRVMSIFHYALNAAGLLFLGTSESTATSPELFSVADGRWKFFVRETGLRRSMLRMRDGPPAPAPSGFPRQSADSGQEHRLTERLPAFREATERALLAHHGTCGVLVNMRGDILYIYGHTGKYLEPAPGAPAMNVLSMARDGLRCALKTALYRAVVHGDEARQSNVRFLADEGGVRTDITVKPTPLRGSKTQNDEAFLIILEQVSDGTDEAPAARSQSSFRPGSLEARLTSTERNLRIKEEYLQITLEELESSNAELRSMNEDLQSLSEEMQSSNEELETSKEELHCLNEELSLVNSELHAKVAELSRANSDMNNLLTTTGIGALFIDQEGRIARFTPEVKRILHVLPTDQGRLLEHTFSNFDEYDHLAKDVKIVLDTLEPIETEVRTRAGQWYLMRIRPYRTPEGVVDGALITFVDITHRKKAEIALKTGREDIAATNQPKRLRDHP